MTTTRKLAELFRALAMDDLSGATAVAEQLCKLEERKGHRTAARQLRGALHAGRSNGSAHAAQFNDRGDLFSTALVKSDESRTLSSVVLNGEARAELENVKLEWKHRAKLQTVEIAPRSKLLFHGPPGCGKSLAGLALARELALPAYIVRFDAVIGAFLGQTAVHLRQLFHFAEINPCVLILDELDALGKKRGNPLDVGELDRIVISLLQELEHSKPMGLIIGTTNLSKNLDDALWRRFDLTLEFKAPSRVVLTPFINRIAAQRRVKLDAKTIRTATLARSFADAEKIVVNAIRRSVLESSKGS